MQAGGKREVEECTLVHLLLLLTADPKINRSRDALDWLRARKLAAMSQRESRPTWQMLVKNETGTRWEL